MFLCFMISRIDQHYVFFLNLFILKTLLTVSQWKIGMIKKASSKAFQRVFTHNFSRLDEFPKFFLGFLQNYGTKV